MTPRSAVKRRNRELLIFLAGLLVGVFSSTCIFFHYISIIQAPLGQFDIHNLQSQLHASIRPSNFQTSVAVTVENPVDEGWKLLHVYYGNAVHLADVTSLPTPYFRANQWFSQYRQDEIISRLFREKRGGFFIDLAANDAVRISNTYALETYYDWNGLCLEPNSEYWSGLAYRKCHVVAAVVGNRTMEEIEFQFPKDKAPKGGIVGQDFDNKQVKAGETQRRYTVSLLDIFRRFKVPAVIDYLSLDVEGAEELVLSNILPMEDYLFLTLTVERPSESLTALLTSHGYNLLTTLKPRTETLWVHMSAKDHLNVEAALAIDSANYKYRENSDHARIAPESLPV